MCSECKDLLIKKVYVYCNIYVLIKIEISICEYSGFVVV